MDRVVVRAGWNGDAVADRDHLPHVLGDAALVLLAVAGARDLWVGLHHDAREGAVDAGLPRAFRALLAVVVRRRVLAEVPHVAGRVLGEPVVRVLDDVAASVR